MELGQAEPLCILNHYNSGVGHVDSNLDDCCGHQHLDLTFGKLLHQQIFLLGLHFSVQVLDPHRLRQVFSELFCVVHHIFRFYHLTGFHHGTDDIGLAACRRLPLDKPVGVLPVVRAHHAVFDGFSVGRKLIDNGNIQIAVDDDG